MKKKTTKRLTKKERLIKKIKTIIKQDGDFLIEDIKNAKLILTESKTFGQKVLASLAEEFDYDCVTVGYYFNDCRIDEAVIEYKNFTVDVLEEILSLAEEWSVICYKTMKRASN